MPNPGSKQSQELSKNDHVGRPKQKTGKNQKERMRSQSAGSVRSNRTSSKGRSTSNKRKKKVWMPKRNLTTFVHDKGGQDTLRQLNNFKVKALHDLAVTYIDPANSRPLRLPSSEPTAVTSLGTPFTWKVPIVSPYGSGFGRLPQGSSMMFAHNDVLRPVIVPVQEAGTDVYTWVFINEHSPTGLGYDPERGYVVGANGASVFVDTNFGVFNHLVNYFPIRARADAAPSIKPGVADKWVLPIPGVLTSTTLDMDILMPVVAAVSTNNEARNGPILFAASCDSNTAETNPRNGSFMFNGGEMLKVTGGTFIELPEGARADVECELVRYCGTGMVIKPHPDGFRGSTEFVLQINKSYVGAFEVVNLPPPDTVTEGPPPTTERTYDMVSYPTVGYLGIRVKSVKITTSAELDLKALWFSVEQIPFITPSLQPNQSPTTTFTINTIAVHASSDEAAGGTVSVAKFGMYPHAVWCTLCPPAFARNMFSQFLAVRTNSTGVLMTNVTNHLLMEGLVFSASLDAVSLFCDVSYSMVASLATNTGPTGYSAVGYYGDLKKGAYTWFKPGMATDNPLRRSASFQNDIVEANVPLISLTDRSPVHAFLVRDTDYSTATSLLIRANQHVEFIPMDHELIPRLPSAMTVASFDEVRMVLMGTRENTENWVHIAQLWNSIKKGAVNVVKAGMGAAGAAAVKELLIGAGTFALL